MIEFSFKKSVPLCSLTKQYLQQFLIISIISYVITSYLIVEYLLPGWSLDNKRQFLQTGVDMFWINSIKLFELLIYHQCNKWACTLSQLVEVLFCSFPISIFLTEFNYIRSKLAFYIYFKHLKKLNCLFEKLIFKRLLNIWSFLSTIYLVSKRRIFWKKLMHLTTVLFKWKQNDNHIQ